MTFIRQPRSILTMALLVGVFCALAMWLAGASPASAQQAPGGNPPAGVQPGGPPPGAQPGEGRGGQAGGRGGQAGGRAGGGRAAAVPDDNAGFESIFDGSTLKNWDGNPDFWRVENGEIIAQSTPEKKITDNTFLVWKGGTVKDFELKLEFRISAAANSGVQYRSKMMNVENRNKWAMSGPQADFDGKDTFTGSYYEENMRGFLAQRGQVMRRAPGGASKLMASLGTGDELKAVIKPNDWNSLHIIAKGNTMIHIINGRVMAILVDEQTDYDQRLTEGLLGLQMHVGQPMVNEFRNIMLKKL